MLLFVILKVAGRLEVPRKSTVTAVIVTSVSSGRSVASRLLSFPVEIDCRAVFNGACAAVQV